MNEGSRRNEGREAMTDTQTARPTDRGLVSETIAVLGAGGTMGFPVARNIAQSGLPVRVWNRSRAKAQPLVAHGAYVARTPLDAANGAGIVITMLADEDAVMQAMDGPDGALRAMSGAHPVNDATASEPCGPHHALWVQMGTIGEAATRRCAELAKRSGIGFVDAPVLGTRQPAEEGKLVILESGPEEARHRLAPVFDAIGQRAIRAGEAGAGSRLKTVVNCWVLAVVRAGTETMALAEGLELDPALFFRAIDEDAGLARRAAEERDLDLPIVEALARRYAEVAKEHGDKDFSATYLLSTPNPD
jgi:3-hydroxyisobutyrate dehydrogenase